MKIIAVDTTSELKLRAVKKTLARAEINAQVVGYKADSGVPEQPVGEEQIITGATNRAKNALKQDSKANYGIGIESGIIPKGLRYFDIACCIILNRKYQVAGISFSATTEIPPNIIRLIEGGKYANLGVVAQMLGKVQEKDPILWLSDNRMKRNELLEDAVFLALTREFLNPEAYR